MKRYFGLFVVVAMLSMALGCQMPGMPGAPSATTSFNVGSLPQDQQDYLKSNMTGDKGAVVLEFPGYSASRSMSTWGNTQADADWATANTNVYGMFLYDSAGNLYSAAPQLKGATGFGSTIPFCVPAGTYKVVVLAAYNLGCDPAYIASLDAARSPAQKAAGFHYTAQTSGYRNFVLAAGQGLTSGNAQITIAQGFITAVNVEMTTITFHMTTPATANCGDTVIVNLSGNYAIPNIRMYATGSSVNFQGGYDTNNLADVTSLRRIITPAPAGYSNFDAFGNAITTNTDANYNASTYGWSGDYEFTMPPSPTGAYNVWFSLSSAMAIIDTNINKSLIYSNGNVQGGADWSMPLKVAGGSSNQSLFPLTFTTAQITTSYGPTGVSGTVSSIHVNPN